MRRSEATEQIPHRPRPIFIATTTRFSAKTSHYGVYFTRKQVEKGAQVAITATPNVTYRFNRWTGNIEQNPYTLTVTEDLDLEAEFESTL